jgi:hypothetical protein
MTWKADGVLPPGSTLEPRDNYALLHFRAPGLVDHTPILGFLCGPQAPDGRKPILGIALADCDTANRPDADTAIMDPDGTISKGPRRWPNLNAWIADISSRSRDPRTAS